MSSHDLPAAVVQVGRHAADDASVRARVAIGFGSPADDTGVTRLDLNDILVKHAQATFLMRVAGSSMRDAGIDDGDLVLVDRAILPAHGHIVVAVVEEEFVCRRLFKQGSDVRLRVANAVGVDIVLAEGQELVIWGVVTNAIKQLAA